MSSSIYHVQLSDTLIGSQILGYDICKSVLTVPILIDLTSAQAQFFTNHDIHLISHQ